MFGLRALSLYVHAFVPATANIPCLWPVGRGLSFHPQGHLPAKLAGAHIMHNTSALQGYAMVRRGRAE